MICNKISNVYHKMTFKEILSHLAEQSKNTNKQCSHVQDGSQLSKHFTVPCGKMMVQHEHSFPLHYEWMIQTWKSMILNISLFEINIPVFDYQCNSNSLLLTEPDGMSFKQIAKVCGRNPSLCYHIQHFMQTYQDEACVVQVMYFLLQKTLQVTVNMYYDRYQAQRCSNCLTSYMKVYPLQNMEYSLFFKEKVDKIISRKHHKLSTRAGTASYNGSALQFGFIYNRTVSETVSVLLTKPFTSRYHQNHGNIAQDTILVHHRTHLLCIPYMVGADPLHFSSNMILTTFGSQYIHTANCLFILSFKA